MARFGKPDSGGGSQLEDTRPKPTASSCSLASSNVVTRPSVTNCVELDSAREDPCTNMEHDEPTSVDRDEQRRMGGCPKWLHVRESDEDRWRTTNSSSPQLTALLP